MQIILIIVLAGLAIWVNDMLNTVPKLKQIVTVLIVVVAVLLLLQSLGVMNSHVRIN